MRSSLFCLCILLFVATRQGALGQGWWMNQPYENAKSFNYIVEMGTNVTLQCTNETYLSMYTFQFWVRPDLQVMGPGYNETFWTIDGDSGWMVNSTSGELTVSILQEQQMGFYHCVLQDNTTGEFYITKRGINYKSPYYGPLWPKYRKSTIIGCSAAGGFLVLCIILLLVCKFQVSADYDDYEDDSDVTSRTSRSLSDRKMDPLEGSSGASSLSDTQKKGYSVDGFTNEALDVELAAVEGLRYRDIGAEDFTTF